MWRKHKIYLGMEDVMSVCACVCVCVCVRTQHNNTSTAQMGARGERKHVHNRWWFNIFLSLTSTHPLHTQIHIHTHTQTYKHTYTDEYNLKHFLYNIYNNLTCVSTRIRINKMITEHTEIYFLPQKMLFTSKHELSPDWKIRHVLLFSLFPFTLFPFCHLDSLWCLDPNLICSLWHSLYSFLLSFSCCSGFPLSPSLSLHSL